MMKTMDSARGLGAQPQRYSFLTSNEAQLAAYEYLQTIPQSMKSKRKPSTFREFAQDFGPRGLSGQVSLGPAELRC